MISLLDHEKLQGQAHALEAMVVEQTRDLATMVKELEAFAYSVAHDLRAPLRAIHSSSRVLLEDRGTTWNASFTPASA